MGPLFFLDELQTTPVSRDRSRAGAARPATGPPPPRWGGDGEESPGAYTDQS
jgi:hypothetical protein